MASTVSSYARGETRSEHNSFFGNCTSINTLLQNTKEWRNDMNEAIFLRLENKSKIVTCLDNNQKGYNVKYQRFGKSNRFVKVTGCVIKKYYYSTLEDNEICQHVSITYFNQAIPSAHDMPHFEKISILRTCDTFMSLEDLFQANETLHHTNIFPTITNEKVDFTGKRVNEYKKLCVLFFNVNMLRQSLAGNYRRNSNEIRFVPFMPNECKTDNTIEVMKCMNSLKNTFLFKTLSIFNTR